MNRWCSSSVQSSGQTSTRAPGLISPGVTTRGPVPACNSIPAHMSAAQPSGGPTSPLAAWCNLEMQVNSHFAKKQVARRPGYTQGLCSGHARRAPTRPRIGCQRHGPTPRGGQGRARNRRTHRTHARESARADCRTTHARRRPAGGCVPPCGSAVGVPDPRCTVVGRRQGKALLESFIFSSCRCTRKGVD